MRTDSALQAGVSPNTANTHQIPINAETFLDRVQSGVALGRACQAVKLNLQAALAAGLLQVNEPAMHVIGTGDHCDVSGSEALKNFRREQGVLHRVLGFVLERNSFLINAM